MVNVSSTTQNSIINTQSFFGRVQQNLQQLSTKEKVVAAVATIFAVAATVIASVTAAGFIATSIGAGVAAGLAGLVGASALGFLFLRKPAPQPIAPLSTRQRFEQAARNAAQQVKSAAVNAAKYVAKHPVRTAFGLAAIAAGAHIGNTFRKNLSAQSHDLTLTTRLSKAASLTKTDISNQTLNATAFLVDHTTASYAAARNAVVNAGRKMANGASQAKGFSKDFLNGIGTYASSIAQEISKRVDARRGVQIGPNDAASSSNTNSQPTTNN